jgi:hypothetical protein
MYAAKDALALLLTTYPQHPPVAHMVDAVQFAPIAQLVPLAHVVEKFTVGNIYETIILTFNFNNNQIN